MADKEYTPTTSEKKILDALADPENYLLSVTQLCTKTGVARNTYYLAIKKPGFVKKRNEILNRVFESFVPDVKKAAVKYAINNAKNFQDRKMILEMTGEYKPSQDVNLHEDMSEAEIDKKLKEVEKEIE